MAKLVIIKNFNQRRKKFEHFKIRTRKLVLVLSILLNIYLLYRLH